MLFVKKGMRMWDFGKLGDITLQILKNPDTVTSDDFMIVYNITYKFCTQPTTKYEIKGAPIYDMLVEVMKTYTGSIESFSSIEAFNYEFERFGKAVSILVSAYGYLERYYIKTSMMKGDNNVRKIKNLLYFYYYTNYVDKLKFVFENMVLLEIASIRSERLGISELKTAMNAYWTLLLCSDQENRYVALKELYIAAFKNEVHYNDPISKLIPVFCRELLIISEIFDASSYEQLSKRIVLRLDARSGEIVDYILGRIERRKTFRHAYRILEIMSQTHIEALVKKLEGYIDNRLKLCTEFDSVFRFYVELTVYVEGGLNRNKNVKKMIKERFHHIVNAYISIEPRDKARQFLERLVDKISTITEHTDRETAKAIMSFFGLVERKELVMEQVVFNLQRRLLLGSRELKTEQLLLTYIGGVVQHDEIFKAKMSLADMVFSMRLYTTNYELSGMHCRDVQGSDFIIEPMFLTSGFWNLAKGNNTKLIKRLDRPAKHLMDMLGKTYKRSLVEFNYIASAIILEFKASRIVLQTDIAPILLTIESYGEVSFKKLENISEDPNLRKSLGILVENRLINILNNVFSVNYDYCGGDLNLFDINYTETERSAGKSPASAHAEREMLIEAEIMRLMKKAKTCGRSSLIHAMKKLGFLHDETIDAVKNLANNSYIEIDDSSVRYIP